MDVFAIQTESNFKSSDEFSAYIKAHRLELKPNEQLLESSFVPCERFGKFCIKYKLKAKVHFILNGQDKESDYIFQEPRLRFYSSQMGRFREHSIYWKYARQECCPDEHEKLKNEF